MQVDVKSWQCKHPNWKGREPFRMLLFADLHACNTWMNNSKVTSLVQQANSLKPDAIFLLGDYPGHLPFSKPGNPAEIASILSSLHAECGVFAVFGNHDWKDDSKARNSNASLTKWHLAFRSAGIHTLVNQSTVIEKSGVSIGLTGLDSQRAIRRHFPLRYEGKDNLTEAQRGLAQTDFNILLAHEPDIFPSLNCEADLTLSGHTHGGQIRLFGRSWIVPSRYGSKFDYGIHKDGNKHLIVSGGLGCSVLPFRIDIKPELTIVTLI